MTLWGGMDASGQTALVHGHRRDIYVCCIVLFNGYERISEALRRIRYEHGIAAADEFHAHQLPEEIQMAVLGAGVKLDMRVCAVIYDKGLMSEKGIALPAPGHFHKEAALTLLPNVLRSYPLVRLLCDEDMQGREQQVFATGAKRINRLIRPDTRLSIGFKRSRSSDLIQVADVMGYGLFRLMRGAVVLPDLLDLLRSIYTDDRNIIMEVPSQSE